jgi:predicted dehydrogenase
MDRKLRLGVIGAGDFAEACHIPGLQSHPLAEVIALCGRRHANARAMADRLNVPDIHTDYRELCSRKDIDAVTICTPNAEHAAQALTALAEGKHVFCEKPLAMTVSQAREMATAAERSGKIHQVGFTFRYCYGVRELRRRVQRGDIGKPYYLRIQYDSWDGLDCNWRTGWREKRDLAGGGLLFDVGSHLFDVARFILGPIVAVTGFLHHIPRQRTDKRTGLLTDVETDDIAAAWFCFERGMRGQWFISRATPCFTDNGYVEVIGPDGAFKASLSRGKIDVLKASSPTQPHWVELPLPDEAYDKKPHCLAIMMRSFVEACLRGKPDGDIDASFHDGLAAQEDLAGVSEANDRLEWIRLSPNVNINHIA